MQFRAGLIQQKNQAVRAVGSENRLQLYEHWLFLISFRKQLRELLRVQLKRRRLRHRNIQHITRYLYLLWRR
jgi:hypothetical protein